MICRSGFVQPASQPSVRPPLRGGSTKDKFSRPNVLPSTDNGTARKQFGETQNDEDHVHEKKSGWIKYTEINKGMEMSL
jgi:hypothetical protein